MKAAEFLTKAGEIGLSEAWTTLDNIKYIKLKSGEIVFPNVKYCRFRLNSKRGIEIKYGTYELYGSKITGVHPTYDYLAMDIPMVNGSIYKSKEYTAVPKAGDMFRATSGDRVIFDSPIMAVYTAYNLCHIDLAKTMKKPDMHVYADAEFSIYDPFKKSESSIFKGVDYINFIEEKVYKKNYARLIRFKNIVEIK